MTFNGHPERPHRSPRPVRSGPYARYPPFEAVETTMTRITGIRRLDETIQPPTGIGDNWHMSWARDDKQYMGLCDGRGWSSLPGYTGQDFNTNLYRLAGQAPNHAF